MASKYQLPCHLDSYGAHSVHVEKINSGESILKKKVFKMYFARFDLLVVDI